MAFSQCPKCGFQLEEEAEQCPRCGPEANDATREETSQQRSKRDREPLDDRLDRLWDNIDSVTLAFVVGTATALLLSSLSAFAGEDGYHLTAQFFSWLAFLTYSGGFLASAAIWIAEKRLRG